MTTATETFKCTVASAAKAGVQVWLTSDQAGSNVIDGPATTDISGNVVFTVDVGVTVYRWQTLSGFLFPNPTSLVTAGGATSTVDGVATPAGTDIAPRNGPCAPWVAGTDVAALNSVANAIAKQCAALVVTPAQAQAFCTQAALAASEILYELSGRVFTGGDCGPVTIRPVARPTDADSRTGIASWLSSWGYCANSYGSLNTGMASHYGCSNPPEIDLGAYPVTDIVKVLIDGVVIPANEYELRDYRTLVRMRPTASSQPTERWGWPTCQINDLPDSQPGTFSITYLYGQPAPAIGALAALKLAEYLVLPQLGDSSKYPVNVTSVQRQGITAQVASVINVLEKGSLGIYEVDAFILAVNPKKLQRQAAVWSPDLGRPRRTATPST